MGGGAHGRGGLRVGSSCREQGTGLDRSISVLVVLVTALGHSASPVMWQHLALLYCALSSRCTRVPRAHCSVPAQPVAPQRGGEGVWGLQQRAVGHRDRAELQSLAGRFPAG